MNRLFVLFIILLNCLFVSGCAVNSTTGRIEVTNRTDKDAANIKIGDQVIIYSLPAGTSQDYWFFYGMRGEVTAEGGFKSQPATVYGKDSNGLAKISERAEFKLNYHGFITLQIAMGEYQIIADIGKEQSN